MEQAGQTYCPDATRQPRATEMHPQLGAFRRFVEFCHALFARPGFLAGVDCAQSYKDYVPRYYRGLFGPDAPVLNGRELKWFRRLELVLSLAPGSTIVDYGGGYGLDSLFLATAGYRTVLFEITPNHVAIAEHFRDEWAKAHGPAPMRTMLAKREDWSAIEPVDAVFLNEVAHHIEPPGKAFAHAARILRPRGNLFLLEPNYLSLPSQLYFLRVRGFRTVIRQVDRETGEEFLYGNEHIRPHFRWNRIANEAGFELIDEHCVVPWLLRDPESLASARRRALENLPGARRLLASHITFHYRKR